MRVCEASDEHDGGGVQERSGGRDGRLEILGEPALRLIQAKKRSTTQRRGRTAKPTWELADDLDDDGGGRGDAGKIVSGIGENRLDEQEQPAGRGQERAPAVAILDVGAMRLEDEPAPVGVDEGVAFAADLP